ncbi:MICOS complex subunit MIC19 [Helicoverpa armigera]|uniref:MICOS complex subunit MIC19 n=1 Tax=Helicoverpa armigera TaxID=29058 RepID=UPI000B3B00D4|nr:MICOS complex subunit MIC19 [Helicoverpa armigera]XP_047023010.1 MICOS complex subunit MIC19-like [Helicoverpa zea]PZC80196.1 hypothetical protein B5X24_HaOG215287 [Helicoverpa armigera]
MGTFVSKDTRRISFDNTFAFSPPISLQKSIEAENVIAFDNLPPEPTDELLFKDKGVDYQDDGEMDYWSHRIDYLKKEHQIINKIIEAEYDKNIETTNKTFESPKITHERIQKIKPCFDWRVKIMKCYEDNTHQPLVCSALVQAFTNCVTNCRLED